VVKRKKSEIRGGFVLIPLFLTIQHGFSTNYKKTSVEALLNVVFLNSPEVVHVCGRF